MPAPVYNASRTDLTSTRPARRFEPVDLGTSDWTPPEEFGTEARGLLLGAAGDVKVDGADYGVGVVLPLLAGEHAMSVTKIYKEGTTVERIVALG